MTDRAGASTAEAEPSEIVNDGAEIQDEASAENGTVHRSPWLLPNSLKMRVISGALLVVVTVAAAAIVIVDFAGRLPDGAAFRLADQVVTEEEMHNRTNVLSGLYGIQPPADPARRDAYSRDTAKAVAVSMVLDRAAQSEGVVIPEKSAQDELANLIQQSYQGNRQAFTTMLGQKGISEKEVLDEIARQLRNTRLFGKVTAPARPANDEQARSYFDAHQSEMVSPEQRRLANVIVRSREEAQQVADQAAAGADFAALARDHSIDEQTRHQGGDLGLVAAQDLEPAYSQAAFGAGANATFGPVQTQSGWNVGKVVEVKQSTPLPFEQLKDAIKARMDNDAKISLWREWLGDHIKAAQVEYAPKYQPAAPDAPPADATR